MDCIETKVQPTIIYLLLQQLKRKAPAKIIPQAIDALQVMCELAPECREEFLDLQGEDLIEQYASHSNREIKLAVERFQTKVPDEIFQIHY